MRRKLPANVEATLLDDTVEFPIRKRMLMHMLMGEEDACNPILEKLFKDAKNPETEKSIYDKKIRELDALMEQMNEGPLRMGTFVSVLPGRKANPRAHVILEDGSTAYVTIPDKKLVKQLECGDTILLAAQAKAVLDRDVSLPVAGEEARFERSIDGGRVEASLRGQERHVFRVASALAREIESGAVAPGRQLLVSPRRKMAFAAVPETNGPSHYRFLCKEPVPDVVIERDIGSPPRYIEDILFRARIAMRCPELYERYGISRCATKLLAGISGSGKTFSLQGLWRALYELMADVTGVPIEELPPRVMRLRTSQILSKWFGEAEQNLDRFFDEAEAIATEPFVAPDGREYDLPLLVVLEEIDGLARARGEEAILSRIQTTALQRLDPSRPELRDKVIFFIATTNVPGQIDTAFFRRIGGTVEPFGRLRRREFVAVLEKHLRRRPLAKSAGTWSDVVTTATGWFFGPDSHDPGQVEIQYTASGTTDTKYRRDFLTAALVERAVQEACFEACRGEEAGDGETGISVRALLDAFDRQVRAIVDQLEPANADSYVDVPDGARVATVRRVRRPSVLPHQLERAA